MDRDRYLSWVEISEQALSNNIRRFKEHIGRDVRLAAVLKANAYGHGLEETSRIARKAGADWLAVNSVEEAALLRHAGLQAPIICLAYVPLACLGDAVALEARLTVFNMETVERLGAITSRMKKAARLHIKVETGTNRQGAKGDDLLRLAQAVGRYPYLTLEGLSTHFANIEDVTEHQFAEHQLSNFRAAVDLLEQNGISAPVKHTACTAAAILFPKTLFNLARVGIGMYGLWPSKETRISALQAGISLNELEPVLTWKTRIAQIKAVPPGATIGYGCTDLTTQVTRIAVLPVGYFEGYDRRLSSIGYVLIRGLRAPLRGRVCMNMIMVDVTNIPGVTLEDEVVLLGRQGEDAISAETLAGKIGTINYEIIARINALIPRVVV
jgi:alanine racemase